MSMPEPPLLDDENWAGTLDAAIELARRYTPEWARLVESELARLKENQLPNAETMDPGITLLLVLTELTRFVRRAVNGTPRKHRLAFLNFIGAGRLPPLPAQVPLTFTPAHESGRVVVPARTQAFATGITKKVIFETRDALTVLPLTIGAAMLLNPDSDSYQNLSTLISPVTPGNGAAPSPSRGFLLPDPSLRNLPLEHKMYMGLGFLAGLTSEQLSEESAANLAALKAKLKKKKIQELDIHIAGTGITRNMFNTWSTTTSAGKPAALQPRIVESGGETRFIFQDLAFPGESMVSEQPDFWLAVQPGVSLKPGADLPLIENFALTMRGKDLAPEFMLFNNTRLPAAKKFMPLGATPRVGDAFYIASEEAFAREGSRVMLSIEIAGAPLLGINVVLKWEYWSGNAWECLGYSRGPATAPLEPFDEYDFHDDTEAFSRGGNILFRAPPAASLKLNGETAPWIRAVITRGDYGKASTPSEVSTTAKALRALPADLLSSAQKGRILSGLSKQTGSSRSTPATYTPPSVQSLRISYETPRLAFPAVRILNNFIPAVIQDDAQTASTNVSFAPYEVMENARGDSLLYLGLDDPGAGSDSKSNVAQGDAPSGSANETPLNSGQALAELLEQRRKTDGLPGNEMTFLFTFDAYYERRRSSGANQGPVPEIFQPEWQYYDPGNGWPDLDAGGSESRNDVFSRGGIIKVFLPRDAQPERFTIRGKSASGAATTTSATKPFPTRYWLRLKGPTTGWKQLPLSYGIFPNSIVARNSVLVEEEILGSGTGKPKLELRFKQRPILNDPVVQVLEKVLPDENELRELRLKLLEKDPDITDFYDENEEGGFWITWLQVDSFAITQSTSRAYMLDAVDGTVIFGNGTHGRIPSLGKRNIRAKRYYWGGGAAGNVAARSIAAKTNAVKGIAVITNYIAASGGADQESGGQALAHAGRHIRNRGRAVTGEDFRNLASEYASLVARAACITHDEKIYVAVLPRFDASAEGLSSMTAGGHSNDHRGQDTEEGFLNSVEQRLRARAPVTLANRVHIIGPEFVRVYVDGEVEYDSGGLPERIEDVIKQSLRAFLNPVSGGPDKQGWGFAENPRVMQAESLLLDIQGIVAIKSLSLRALRSGDWKLDRLGVAHEVPLITGALEMVAPGIINIKAVPHAV